MITTAVPERSLRPALLPHRVEDLGDAPLGLVRLRVPLLAEAATGIGTRPLGRDMLLSNCEHLQIIGPAPRTRATVQVVVERLLQLRAEVESPGAVGADGHLSMSSLLCSVSDVVAILLRREQNLLDERDAIFPPLVLVLDRYDEMLRVVASDARAQLAIDHGIGEILRGGDAVGVHLVITAAAAVDDARLSTIHADLFVG